MFKCAVGDIIGLSFAEPMEIGDIITGETAGEVYQVVRELPPSDQDLAEYPYSYEAEVIQKLS